MEKQSTPVTLTSTESVKKPEEESVESTPADPVVAVAPVVNGNGTHKQPENNNQKVEELYDIPVGTYFHFKNITHPLKIE